MVDSRPDARTLAYINLYAVLGTLENLCELDEGARALLTNKKPIAIGFQVKGGPSATLTFYPNGRCRMEDGLTQCDILLPFSSRPSESFSSSHVSCSSDMEIMSLSPSSVLSAMKW